MGIPLPPVPRINPFEPDKPAKPEIFSGRRAEVEQIRTALYRTAKGKSQHLLVEGDRGIGKSSLANYADHLAAASESIFGDEGIRVLGVFVSLGTCRNTDEVCTSILSEAYTKIRSLSGALLANVSDLLSKVDGINVGWLGVRLKEPSKASGALSASFVSLLESFWEKAKDHYSAMLIVLDETETIAMQVDFAPFCKSMLEKLSHDGSENIMFMVTASPFALGALVRAHPTFARGFTPIRITDLLRTESDELVNKVLAQGTPKVTANDDFLVKLYHYSSGIPSFIHELGKAAFDVNQDSILDWEDLQRGILGTESIKGALSTLEDKHFRHRYTQRVLSNTYRELLNVIASYDEDVVTSPQIRERFTGDHRLIGPYLGTMVRRGVLDKVPGKRGQYKLPDRMFKIFLRLRAQRYMRAARTSTDKSRDEG